MVNPTPAPTNQGAQDAQPGRAGCGFLHLADLQTKTPLRRKPTPGNPRGPRWQSSLDRRRRPPRSFSTRGEASQTPTLLPLVENVPSGDARARSRRPGMGRRKAKKNSVPFSSSGRLPFSSEMKMPQRCHTSFHFSQITRRFYCHLAIFNQTKIEFGNIAAFLKTPRIDRGALFVKSFVSMVPEAGIEPAHPYG